MTVAQISVPLANLHGAPASDARLGSQLLFGEIIDVSSVADGWAMVRARSDGYEGHVRESDISQQLTDATHRVSVPSTFHYPAANIKQQPARALYLNSTVAVTRIDGELAELATGGFVFANHLTALGIPAADTVAVAEQFCGVPYLWGGKSFAGIDCSGLVQMARTAGGVPSARDSGQQEAAGEKLPLSLLDGETARGLLIFWPGHVAITIDARRIVHASGHVMQVVIEDREAAIARIAAKGSAVSSVQRL